MIIEKKMVNLLGNLAISAIYSRTILVLVSLLLVHHGTIDVMILNLAKTGENKHSIYCDVLCIMGHAYHFDID